MKYTFLSVDHSFKVYFKCTEFPQGYAYNCNQGTFKIFCKRRDTYNTNKVGIPLYFKLRVHKP